MSNNTENRNDFGGSKGSAEVYSTLDNKYFTFWLENQLYAIPVQDVVTIIGIMPFRAIPEMPYYMKGLINLRGDIIPVIDLRLRLNKPSHEYDDQSSIILINFEDRVTGFVIDRVEEVVNIPKEEFSDSKHISHEYNLEYLNGISTHNDRITLHLDLHKLMENDDLKINWN